MITPAHPDGHLEDSADPWETLVTTALLGTDRRGLPESLGWGEASPALADASALVERSDQTCALLDLAALGTVHRRAGLRPAKAETPPDPAPPDPRPELPAAAEKRLLMLLTHTRRLGSGAAQGTTPNASELLPQWLAAARGQGYQVPASLLPALLDAARGRSDLRSDALALAGPRGLWLARHNPDWKFALRATHAGRAHGAKSQPGSTPSERGAGDSAERRLWDEGLFTERVALLTHLRQREPAAGLALLRSTWASERAEERLLFLDALRHGLSGADEPFLEGALTDQSKNVRSTAAELLGGLPGSALGGRMAERARACVRLHTADGDSWIEVEPPGVCDQAMQHDGVLLKPPTGRGKRAWWFGQVVESTPLSLWHEIFAATPRDIVALRVDQAWRGDLHAAWSRAAVRQQNVSWARALLGAPLGGVRGVNRKPSADQAIGPAELAVGAFAASPAGTAGDPARLLSVLPEEERASWVARFIEAHGLSEAFQMLGVCAVPWSEPLGKAVINALNIARDSGHYPWSFSGVMGLAERCLDPAQVARVDVLTAPPETDGSPGAGGHWSEAFQRLASTLRLRTTMLQELHDGPSAAGDTGPTHEKP